MLNSIGVHYNITLYFIILLHGIEASYFHLYFSLQNRKTVNRYIMFPTKVKNKITTANKMSFRSRRLPRLY